MAFPIRDIEQITSSVFSLMPRSRFWSKTPIDVVSGEGAQAPFIEQESENLPDEVDWRSYGVLYRLFMAPAIQIKKAQQRAQQIINEASPGSAVGSVRDWYRYLFNLAPDDISDATLKSRIDQFLDDRRTRYTIAEVTAYALERGVTVSISNMWTTDAEGEVLGIRAHTSVCGTGVCGRMQLGKVTETGYAEVEVTDRGLTGYTNEEIKELLTPLISADTIIRWVFTDQPEEGDIIQTLSSSLNVVQTTSSTDNIIQGVS